MRAQGDPWRREMFKDILAFLFLLLFLSHFSPQNICRSAGSLTQDKSQRTAAHEWTTALRSNFSLCLFLTRKLYWQRPISFYFYTNHGYHTEAPKAEYIYNLSLSAWRLWSIVQWDRGSCTAHPSSQSSGNPSDLGSPQSSGLWPAYIANVGLFISQMRGKIEDSRPIHSAGT